MDRDMAEKRLISHQLKTTIFMPDGSLAPVTSTKRRICNVHLMLAHEVCKCVPDGNNKRKMLDMIEEVYDMGKRMDKGLSFYREKLGLNKSEGRALEKEVADAIDWSKEDDIPSEV